MKRYAVLTAAMMALFLALFAGVEALGLPLLTDPEPWLARGGVLAAGIGLGLLVADVVLPVPASLVMIAHGALFGTVPGALLSLAGGLGAALFGFALGRRGGPLLSRLVSADERRRADRLFARWGTLAILVSRPVPILAETTAILAGTTTMGWGRLILASIAGLIPAAFLYALAGATAVRLDSAPLAFALVLLIAAVTWAIGRAGRPALR